MYKLPVSLGFRWASITSTPVNLHTFASPFHFFLGIHTMAPLFQNKPMIWANRYDNLMTTIEIPTGHLWQKSALEDKRYDFIKVRAGFLETNMRTKHWNGLPESCPLRGAPQEDIKHVLLLYSALGSLPDEWVDSIPAELLGLEGWDYTKLGSQHRQGAKAIAC